jgi:hypothetical protein
VEGEWLGRRVACKNGRTRHGLDRLAAASIAVAVSDAESCPGRWRSVIDAREREGMLAYCCAEGMVSGRSDRQRGSRAASIEASVEDSKVALSQLFCLRNFAGRAIDWGCK